MPDANLVGIGIYTPSEAAALCGINAGKITRWLRGHDAGRKHYDRLWKPQIDLDDGKVYLGFRDLMEVRVANAFIKEGLSAQKVRRAIQLAREMIGEDRPLSTAKFRTDGHTVFLQMLREQGTDSMIDLFRKQYAFRPIIEPSLKNIDFDKTGNPMRWWPAGKAAQIVVDPRRLFGRPIEASSGVPSTVLAAAAEAEGSPELAARLWKVPVSAVRHAVAFEQSMRQRKAA